jgi:GrpB-like predicted nucleotidyltransferase (UPF0157 family)
MTEKQVSVVPYDPDWPRRFEAERLVLEEALGPWLDGDVGHIGSTSVPGWASKPIIDMIAPVRDLEAARGAFELLSALDYQYREHRPEAHAFSKPSVANWWEATNSLYLTERGSDVWRERIAFRDALRADPRLAREYEAWKIRWARPPGSDRAYGAATFPFVARVLVSAGISIKEDRERLSPAARTRQQG